MKHPLLSPVLDTHLQIRYPLIALLLIFRPEQILSVLFTPILHTHFEPSPFFGVDLGYFDHRGDVECVVPSFALGLIDSSLANLNLTVTPQQIPVLQKHPSFEPRVRQSSLLPLDSALLLALVQQLLPFLNAVRNFQQQITSNLVHALC